MGCQCRSRLTHPGGGWQIAGAGNFFGTGLNDVLWYNAGTGQTDVWEIQKENGPAAPALGRIRPDTWWWELAILPATPMAQLAICFTTKALAITINGLLPMANGLAASIWDRIPETIRLPALAPSPAITRPMCCLPNLR